jgi:hypothetical protein
VDANQEVLAYFSIAGRSEAPHSMDYFGLLSRKLRAALAALGLVAAG